jgi:hypothetical protein
VSTYAYLKVLVVTGANTAAPVGAIGGGHGTTGTISDSYSATSNGSWGWLLTADWRALAVPTVGSGESVYDSYTVGGEDTYALIQRSSITASAATPVSLSTTNPTSGAQIAHLYFEMVPSH